MECRMVKISLIIASHMLTIKYLAIILVHMLTIYIIQIRISKLLF